MNVNLYVVGEQGHRKQGLQIFKEHVGFGNTFFCFAASAYFSAASHKYSLVLT